MLSSRACTLTRAAPLPLVATPRPHHSTFRALTISNYHDLDQAEAELASYCSRLPAGEGAKRCRQAHAFLQQKRKSAEAGCAAHNQQDCDALERLNNTAHQLLANGSMDDMAATLCALARVEQLCASTAARQAAAVPAAAAAAAPQQQATDLLHTLFFNMDSDGDGRLSVEEFRTCMRLLGYELEGATVAMMLDAMDAHGFIDEHQFRDIVEAEQLRSHSHVVTCWRHHQHARPAWWSEAPASLLAA